MAATRSSFLVHWTGKAIGCDATKLDDAQRRQYIDLLVAILQNGIRLSCCPETSTFLDHVTHAPGSLVRIPKIACFTETRLSSAHAHAKLYGLMGIGVSREWVLARYGGPVLYTPGFGNDMLAEHLQALIEWFANEFRTRLVLGTKENDDAMAMVHRLADIICFTKPMSDPSASERFTLLDEHEWRVLGAARLETSTFVRIDSANYLALIVKPEDVRILVFPDRRTQELAHARSELKPYLERHPAPTVLTLADAAEL